ncbi:hypothetical protein OIU74_012706 [Salix koriyanagi]|uniref:Uncharacterized protein n=1 Tax=Salix koriyanagi TaxID=2511006 RepID=A0A9Q0Q7I2_9ROSI|nr:hypothetical protein OIU74_012706 [Salix koriyanagi]
MLFQHPSVRNNRCDQLINLTTPLIYENQGLVYNDHQWSMIGTSGVAEPNLPVSTLFSFAGAASTEQLLSSC